MIKDADREQANCKVQETVILSTAKNLRGIA